MTPWVDRGELLMRALRAASRAANGWACYAKRDPEHREIMRLHMEIEAIKSAIKDAEPHEHDPNCESELTSHGYTPCRCGSRELGGMVIPMSGEELDWVRHAASLRDLPPIEYVRRAINLSLREEGVDAVLLAESK